MQQTLIPVPRLKNGVIVGDCASVMAKLPAHSVDLIVTDPPYLVNYTPRDGRTVLNDDNERWMMPAFSEMYRLLKPDTFMVSFYGWHKVDRFMSAWRTAGFKPVAHLVLTKDYRSNSRLVGYRHECAYLLAKGHPEPEQVIDDVLPFRYTGNHLHPAQKPTEALRILIEAFSRPGDLVLDPFAGSGSTLEAAKAAGRRFLGIEIDRQHAFTAFSRVR